MKIERASTSTTTTEASAVVSATIPEAVAAAVLDTIDAVALSQDSFGSPSRKGTGASRSVSTSIPSGSEGMYMCSHLRG